MDIQKYTEDTQSSPTKMIQKEAKGLNKHFPKTDKWPVSKHVKRCSVPLISRGMQIEITRRDPPRHALDGY